MSATANEWLVTEEGEARLQRTRGRLATPDVRLATEARLKHMRGR